MFLRAVLGQPIKKNIATLRLVDPALARSLEGLQSYLQTRKDIESLQLPAAAKRNKLASLTIHGVKLVDLSLDFTLPGYPNVQLKPDGALVDVDDSNLEEYLDRVLEMTLGEGIDKQVKAFKDGFSMIFSVDDMKIFSPDELGLLFGNADEDWSKESKWRSSCLDVSLTLTMNSSGTSYQSRSRLQPRQPSRPKSNPSDERL